MLYEYRKMEYSRTQIDLMQVKPQSLEPYPGPFLEPGITKRIRITAILRSLARKDKKAYRQAAKAARTEAVMCAQRNCWKYLRVPGSYGAELMARMDSDQDPAHGHRAVRGAWPGGRRTWRRRSPWRDPALASTRA